jgi:hypothetical protein
MADEKSVVFVFVTVLTLESVWANNTTDEIPTVSKAVNTND